MEVTKETPCPDNYSSSLRYNFSLELFIHSINVANIAKEIGKKMKLQNREVELLYELALYHDIGKSKIPGSILHKEGSLSSKEWEIMKQHSVYSEELYLSTVSINNKNIDDSRTLRHHHENWDGSGYPDQISGNNIPLYSRIIRIADVFDAITQPRVYRPFKIINTMEIMEKMQGKELDPFIFEISYDILHQLLKHNLSQNIGHWQIEKFDYKY